MKRLTVTGIALAITGLFLSSAHSAKAGLFVFYQTSTTVAGLMVSSSIDINGRLSDLPNISSTANPISFGHLIDLSLTTNAFPKSFSLADFCPATEVSDFGVYCNGEPATLGGPIWSISPNAIDIIDARDENQFDITGFGIDSTIYVASDYEGNPNCGEAGRCYVTGYWTRVPEPPSVALFLTGLLALCLMRLPTEM